MGTPFYDPAQPPPAWVRETMPAAAAAWPPAMPAAPAAWPPAAPAVQAPAAPPPAQPPFELAPAPGSRLAALCELRTAAKAAADEAQQRLEQVIADIKTEAYAEAARLNPGKPAPTDIRLAGSPSRKPLRVFYRTMRRFNSKRLRAEQPAMYESYRDPSGGWVLEEDD